MDHGGCHSVTLLALHGRFLAYEQVSKELVYAIDFAKRKAAESTVSPVSADAISALERH